MITFRYHLVSIAAVLLALAAGVALGAGVLDESSSALSGDDDGSTSADPGLARFESGYAARTSAGLIDGSLDERSVVVMTLPGARADEVRGVTADLERAGATVTGRVDLTAKLVDPANRQFVEGVAQESAGDVEGVSSDGDGYERVGAALARSVLGKDAGALDETATTVGSAFDEGGLVAFDERPERLASLAVLVAGPSRAGETGAVVTSLARAIDAGADGAVLAGPSESSREGGVLAQLRDDDTASQVSTVDVTDTAAGRAVTALALARAADGESGAWGTDRSADGAVPK